MPLVESVQTLKMQGSFQGSGDIPSVHFVEQVLNHQSNDSLGNSDVIDIITK